jgi:hypothetical protein
MNKTGDKTIIKNNRIILDFRFNGELSQRLINDFKKLKINSITFGDKFDQNIDILPKNITSIIFGDKFNQNVDNLPPNLISLTFGHYFNQNIDNLPPNLVNTRFNKQITKLPPKLEILIINEYHKFRLEHLKKPNLKILYHNHQKMINNFFTIKVDINSFSYCRLLLKYL